MSNISLKNINKVYDNGFQAVFDFNLDIKDKEFIVFVGPSGCGKSTTLRMIAGLEDITKGELLINGKYVNNVAPKDRGIAMVFQSYALYPHLDVYQNLAFGLKLAGFDEDEIENRVKETAQILGLQDYLERKPRNLSGGQRQRVALGRAIIRHSDVYLMDEPLSNLDAKQRVYMRSEIIKIHRRVGATTVYVTHDQIEAMTMADRIVVMKLGVVQQIGTPEELYFHPRNLFVAGFIGDPPMNFVKGRVEKGKFIGRTAGLSFDFKGKLKQLEKVEGKEVVLGFRPEDCHLEEKVDGCTYEGVIELTEMLGDSMNIYVMLENTKLIIKTVPNDNYKIGDKIKFGVNCENIHVFDKETELVVE